MGSNFNNLWNDPNFIGQEQKNKIDFEVQLIGKIIEAREQKGITQKELAEMAGLKQSDVAGLESLKSTPQIDTIFKLLEPLGYTLTIVPASTLSSAKTLKP